MNNGIWTVAEAWICATCRQEMVGEYIMREMGPMRRCPCGRCGQERPSCKLIKYTMNRAGLERRGRLEG